jgi:hypothetical protein
VKSLTPMQHSICTDVASYAQVIAIRSVSVRKYQILRMTDYTLWNSMSRYAIVYL